VYTSTFSQKHCSLGGQRAERFLSLFSHIMLVLQEYFLDTASAVGVVLDSVVVEDVREGCLDLVVVVTKLFVRGSGYVVRF